MLLGLLVIQHRSYKKDAKSLGSKEGFSEKATKNSDINRHFSAKIRLDQISLKKADCIFGWDFGWATELLYQRRHN